MPPAGDFVGTAVGTGVDVGVATGIVVAAFIVVGFISGVELDALQIEHCDTDCIGDGLGYDFECEMESYIRGLKYLLKYIL